MSIEGIDARAAHTAGVQRLLASYRAIPPNATVRLAKPTSNLFRARTKTKSKGLDTSGLTGVIAVDPDARTADVAGMCTYEDLVAATLPYGLSPLVVPQLKTITLGGAVTGLGIESSSFRNGLPHESVREMEILEDPYFHPNLSSHHAVPTLRLYPEWTPREIMAKQLDESPDQVTRVTADRIGAVELGGRTDEIDGRVVGGRFVRRCVGCRCHLTGPVEAIT